MFDKNDYKAAFSKVKASGETYREVLNMAKENDNRKRVRGRKLVVLVAAVIMLMAMTVTAFAAENIMSWFQNYFAGNAQEQLTQKQIGYIEKNELVMDQSQTQDGYTLRLKSAITDGKVAYITIGITAPEDVILNKTVIEGYNPQKPTLRFGNSTSFVMDGNGDFPVCRSMLSMEDNDGCDNTQDLLIKISPAIGAEDKNILQQGSIWELHIENLLAYYVNDAYIEELQTTKYADKKGGIAYTEEETELIIPEALLAEGIWDFEITFEDVDTREVELIQGPVTSLMRTRLNADGTDFYEEIAVISFTLRSLSASFQFDDASYAHEYAFDDGRAIYVVMKDGSKVQLVTSSGVPGEVELLAETPIILNNVDYVLLSDGTKLPMPE